MAKGRCEESLYSIVLAAAAKAIIYAEENDFKELLFPFWQRAIHEALIKNGCPCQKGGKDCFLNLTKEEQVMSFADCQLSFEAFVAIIKQARTIFFSSIFSTDMPTN